MEIKKEMQKHINEQIKEELGSSYIYLSMAAYFDANNLSGFAHWMKKQAQEEIEHAMKFYTYLNERGGNVKLKAIDTPKQVWESPKEAFEDALGHERFITACINKLVDKANELDDKATKNFLAWFIEEQVEEEANASEILGKIEMIE